jgi:hypothetical protein
MVRRSPECRMDSRARLSPKYMKNRNIHQYMRTSVIFLSEAYLNRSMKLYYLTCFLSSTTRSTITLMMSWQRALYLR